MQVHSNFAREGLKFRFDAGKSVKFNIENLLSQAKELQVQSGGDNCLEALLHYLVGAKLDLAVGSKVTVHHGSFEGNLRDGRKADFQVEQVAIYITTHPGEAVTRACSANLKAKLHPVIITLPEAIGEATCLLRNAGLLDRVDIFDAIQFLSANVYERSLFEAGGCQISLTSLLGRYNQIVSKWETDRALLVALKE